MYEDGDARCTKAVAQQALEIMKLKLVWRKEKGLPMSMGKPAVDLLGPQQQQQQHPGRQDGHLTSEEQRKQKL